MQSNKDTQMGKPFQSNTVGLRDHFDRFEERVEINSGFEKYRSEVRTRTVPANETRKGHTVLSVWEHFRVGVHLVIIDYLTREFNEQKNWYQDFAAKFSLL